MSIIPLTKEIIKSVLLKHYPTITKTRIKQGVGSMKFTFHINYEGGPTTSVLNAFMWSYFKIRTYAERKINPDNLKIINQLLHKFAEANGLSLTLICSSVDEYNVTFINQSENNYYNTIIIKQDKSYISIPEFNFDKDFRQYKDWDTTAGRFCMDMSRVYHF